MKPLILLTNDDGIKSPGLRALAEELGKIGEIWVAAPHTQQTSAGRSHPPTSSGIITEADGYPAGIHAFSVEASPSQCVDYAILELMPGCPELVISGINSGVNLGSDITRSGTVGAALEAANYGIPSIAASLEIHQDEVFAAEPRADFSIAACFTRLFAEALLEGNYIDDVDVLKIDVPDNAVRSTPWEITKLAKKSFYHPAKPERKTLSDKGRLGWCVEADLTVFDEGTDLHTIFSKRIVSVTPLSMDMTSRISLSSLDKELRGKS
ncbi:MAG TPA: 5'/3'-nucleotidase SurE [Spirochaeta sp.]|nr:5'/3'-nucleotidase SurE [Spirochaeta sp.]